MAYSLNQLYTKLFNKTPTSKFFTYSDQAMFTNVWKRIYELSIQSEAKHISLLGGSTVFKLFAALDSFVNKDNIKWDNLHFWWNDERIVPYESTQSNYGELYRKYLKNLPIKQENLHPVHELKDDSYERMQVEIIRLNNEVKQLIKAGEHGIPEFDLVLLGLGDDGHSASLFPNQFNPEDELLHVHAFQPKTLEKRISQGIVLLKHAKEIVFLAAGVDKAPVLSEIAKYVDYRSDFRDLEANAVNDDDQEFYNTVFWVRSNLMNPNRYQYPAVILAEYVDKVKFVFDKALYEAVVASFNQPIIVPKDLFE